MREFIRTYGKLAGLFAAAALVLSFLTGIVARNPIGTVILRAVLLAVLFGGLGVGLQFVVRRFLSQLSGQPDADSAGAAETGSRVDIVLPEENPLAGPGEEAMASPELVGDASIDLESEPGSVETAEGVGGAGDAEGIGGAEGAGREGAEDALPLGEDIDGAPAGAAGAPSGTVRAGRGAGGGLDSLPDIAGLEPAEAGRARSRTPARRSAAPPWTRRCAGWWRKTPRQWRGPSTPS